MASRVQKFIKKIPGLVGRLVVRASALRQKGLRFVHQSRASTLVAGSLPDPGLGTCKRQPYFPVRI